MKRLLLMLLLVASTNVFAQKEVTKFLGIPVDGFKSEMIQKLKAKGYKYNSTADCLEGEFNGKEVQIVVVTNNNKVYRIAVFDKNYTSETDIKINFNKLCQQFERNERYFSIKEDQTIPEHEDISYEMLVNNKRYEAVFYQKLENEIDYNDVDNALSALENMEKKSVWFMIDERYGKYRLLMFYDNGYNQANGDDL
ncbi:MAG: hypothetical protein J6P83_03120 [Bacteroidales bacterium]|nr:hypothetical protein [Bacteroidales bacterium]